MRRSVMDSFAATATDPRRVPITSEDKARPGIHTLTLTYAHNTIGTINMRGYTTDYIGDVELL